MDVQKTSVEVVSDYIQDKIFNKEWKKGDKIPTEMELTGLLNVSRSSVREAMKLMEAMHVLDIRRGDGTYVSDISDNAFFDTLLYKVILDDISLKELLEFRIQIETAVQYLAMKNATEDDIEKLEKNYSEFERLLNSGNDADLERTRDLDVEFHALVGRSTKNSLMDSVYQLALRAFSPLIMNNYKLGQIREDSNETLIAHRNLLDSIKTKDFYAGISAIQLSTDVWKRWQERGENI